MNMLQILFGRRVGVRCAQPAENAPGPKGRNASIHGLTPLVVAAGLSLGTLSAQAEVIASWTFPVSSQATKAADSQNANLASTVTLTRGTGAPATTGAGFRTTGFKNDGIAVGNTDY